MLETLDAVDWEDLDHAYGEATDIPDLIRALAFGTAEAREQAHDALYGNLWHQNTVFEATAYAVPFLLELLGAPDVPEKDWILQYLHALSHGTSFIDVHQHIPFMASGAFARMKADGEFDDALAEELSWVQEAFEEVQEGVPLYAALLDDPEPPVRTSAAFVLSGFCAGKESSIEALASRLIVESDASVRASLLRALGMAAQGDPSSVSVCTEALPAETDPLPQVAAAMALVQLMRENAPDTAVQVLVAALSAPETLEARYNKLPWTENGMSADICVFLSLLGPRAAAAAGAVTAALTETSYPPAAVDLLGTLLSLLFPGEATAEGLAFAALSPEQQVGVRLAANTDQVWVFDANAGDLLASYGLPGTRDALREYIAGSRG